MRRLLVLMASLLACGPHASTPPAAKPSAAVSNAPKREPVVVAIVVDQFAAWVAESRIPLLPQDGNGGLVRLAREGTWAKHMTYPYAVTDTAPGHAALHTGKTPSESGIFGNELPDPTGPYRVTVLRDPSVKVVSASGVKEEAGSSAARLKVDTVADRLRAARPDALIVSVSLKDRGAIIPGGKHPSHALWFDSYGEGAFVTSTAFATAWPAWAKGIGDKPAIVKSMTVPWTPIDPEWLARSSGVADDAPGEGNIEGTFGTKFPHVAKDAASYRALPASDEAIAALALAGVKAEWDPKKPTLVLMSFSANDVVGHVFGPDSWEAWDLLRRLDVTLGAFIDALEAHVGPVSIVLAADHGNVPMPESTKSRAEHCANDCATGERLGPQAIGVELRAAVAKTLPGIDPKSLISGLADPYLFLGPAARGLDDAKRATLDKTVREVLAKHKGLADVIAWQTLAEKCPAALEKNGDDDFTLVCRSWPRGTPSETGAGDYYLVVARGSFFDAEITPGKGTSHGTPNVLERTVPLLVRTQDKADAGTVIDAPIAFTAYSEIEASLLGLERRSPKEILSRSLRSSGPGSPSKGRPRP